MSHTFTRDTLLSSASLVADRLMKLIKPENEETLASKGETAGYFKRDFGMQEWDWPQGIGIYGLSALMEASHTDTYTGYMIQWYRKNLEGGLPARNINTTAPLLALRDLLVKHPDPELEALCTDWADWLMHELPRTEEDGFQHVTTHSHDRNRLSLHENQLWIDTIFMTVLFLNRMGQDYSREDWTQESIRQVLLHIKYLWERESGLFYHGWTFTERSNFGKVFWCRGNSWFTAGIPIFLEQFKAPLPSSVETILLDTWKAQVKALIALQGEDGLWHTVLDDGTSYTEVSGSAAIAAGILHGIRNGLLDSSYLEYAERAVDAVLANIAADGTVLNVSGGTGIGMDKDHYRNILIAPMAYGQSLTLLAIAEALHVAG